MKNNKSLGQHWLKDRLVLDYIASCLDEGKLVVEIGPGLGTLTSSLLKRFDKVIAIEYDKRLADNLPKSFPGKNLEVINTDFLDFNLEEIKQPYVAAGNIPYYITSPIIMKLLETKNQPQKIVLLIQKEVAERIAAVDGKESVLSLSVKNRAEVELGDVVGKEFFTPPPKVDSQVIILTPHQPLVDEKTIKLIKQGFKAPRKKLAKNLGLSKDQITEIFGKLNISLDARPADLSLETWQNLSRII
ncbi:MAG: 16S rRNA (adenine(1518)-N(6)/adenine(1519)-N(6))-dimethyltransferase RsmA [Candidatus Saccharibacteria bacterium]|nr:16S rRNA (adenine(1518)-N(6)/adenine(1519)-N(6))-dimethyltransferase RsmA [Candidatus Saccharibacteria bacterium]